MTKGLHSIGRSLSFEGGQRLFLLVMLLFSLLLALIILRPFAQPIILAIFLATLSHPIHARLVRVFKGKEIPAALVVVFLITFLIIIPIILFLGALFTQGVDSVNRVDAWIREGNFQQLMDSPRIGGYIAWLEQNLSFIDLEQMDVQGNLMQLSKKSGQVLLSRGAGLLGNITGVVAKFFIMIFVAFFLIKDGERMIVRIKHLSPLRESQEEQILDRVKTVARSVLIGSFSTAVLQGFVGGVGLAIVGIPALFWGAVMGMASLIPVVGTSLIWVPSVIYLVILGHWGSAVFLTLWCMLFVGSIDNFIRPYLMKGQAQMSPFFIFLAIIGGVRVFGLIGVLYGPLIISFATIMLYIYSVEFEQMLIHKSDDDDVPEIEYSI
jgi:predicted PurR-regulated permease PerM